MQYEYKVMPAPTKGQKGNSVKGAEGQFAFAIENTLNQLAARGWEFVRSELLPSQERQGFRSTKTVYRTLLVFRRPLSDGKPNIENDNTQSSPALRASREQAPEEKTAPAGKIASDVEDNISKKDSPAVFMRSKDRMD